MSLGQSESFYELSKRFGVAKISEAQAIHLDCFPNNAIEASDLMPQTNLYFQEINSPSLLRPFRVWPEGVKPGSCKPIKPGEYY